MNGYSVRRSKREMIADLPEEHVAADLIGHSTLEYTTPDGRRIIRFHRTNVVTFHPDGSVTFNTDGHQTVTTKRRLNEHAPRYVYVFQKDYQWYVVTPAGNFPFFDGFTLKRSVPDPGTLAELLRLGALSIYDLFELEARGHPVDAMLTLAIAARTGRVTREALDELPEDVLVDLDAVLEEIS
jgi:hypothetical protein